LHSPFSNELRAFTAGIPFQATKITATAGSVKAKIRSQDDVGI
jgi:hypothetical protein